MPGPHRPAPKLASRILPRQCVKILYLNPAAQFGGAERSLLDVMSEVRALRPDWELSLIAGEDGPLLEAARELGVATRAIEYPSALARFGDSAVASSPGGARWTAKFAAELGRAGIAALSHVPRLRSAISALRPDIVHSNGFKSHILAAWAAPESVPVIWHVRDYVGQRPAMSRLLAMNSRRCALALTNSRSVADDLRTACPRICRIVPIHNGIDLEKFNPVGATADLDKIAGMTQLNNAVVRVGLVATMAQWKGHEIFLRALAMLPRDSQVRGYVIGGSLYSTRGSEASLEQLRRIADGLSLNGTVGFTGFVDDPAAAIRSLDIVVHASTRPEPFGRVIAESMACGKAVIVTAAGGALEIVTSGEDAIAIAPGDPAALADSIRQLACAASLRSQLGAAARKTAEQRFDRARMARELIPIYEELDAARN
jgi:glycosyltransferase involved in cell wall biosynthesis